MESSKPYGDFAAADGPHFNADDAPGEIPAWEEVAAGRYMPRRVRGSCQGRVLG